MTNPPGEGQPPQEPPRDQEQPGYWQQQAQQPYGQPPMPGYGAPPAAYGQPGYAPMAYAPDHPRATTSLVLGILGVVLCQILAPFAWSIGKKTVTEIDASHGAVGGRGAAQAGYIMGIVGTVLLVVAVAFVVIYIIVIIAVIGAGTAGSTT